MQWDGIPACAVVIHGSWLALAWQEGSLNLDAPQHLGTITKLFLDHIPFLALQGTPCVCRTQPVGSGRCGHPSLTAMFVPLVLGQVLSGISQQISDVSGLSPPESSNSALLGMAQLRHPLVM